MGLLMLVNNRVLKIISSALLVVSLGSCAKLLQPNIEQSLVEIKPGNYMLDKKHASVMFKVNHMGFSTFVGRFNEFDASLQYNADDIAQSKLEAVVEMASVDVNNEKFEKALRGSFWLNAENYPQAIFKTTSATVSDDNHVVFNGILTFLGVEKEMALQVKVNGAGNNLLSGKYTLGFSGRAQFNRSDFGLDRYVPTVGDLIEIEVHAEFQRQAD